MSRACCCVGLARSVELVDHIERSTTDTCGRSSRGSALVDKIVAVHGDRHPSWPRCSASTPLRADLEPRLAREEQKPFEMIRQLAATTAGSGSDTRALAAQIDALTLEHETVGDLLDELNRVTSGYAIPADGCATYTVCYWALSDLEADTHLHVHEENTLLFLAAQAEHAGPSTGAMGGLPVIH